MSDVNKDLDIDLGSAPAEEFDPFGPEPTLKTMRRRKPRQSRQKLKSPPRSRNNPMIQNLIRWNRQ